MTNKDITISLPEELIDKLEKKIKETDFDSVSEYMAYVLEQVLEKEIETSRKEQTYSKEEEEAVKNRLKELGYI